MSKVKPNGFTGIIKATVINKEKAVALLLNKVNTLKPRYNEFWLTNINNYALENKHEDLTVNLTHQISQQKSQIEESSNHIEQKLSVVIKGLTE